MDRTHIYAYTAPGACCPEYLSVQGLPKGGVAIHVREDSVIKVSTVHLSDDELLKLAQAITLHLADARAKQLLHQGNAS